MLHACFRLQIKERGGRKKKEKKKEKKKGGVAGGRGRGRTCLIGWLWLDLGLGMWPWVFFFFWHGATLCSACSSIFEQPPPPPRGLHLHDNYGDYANVYPRCYDDDLDSFSGSADTSPHSDYILSEWEYRYGIFEQLYICFTAAHMIMYFLLLKLFQDCWQMSAFFEHTKGSSFDSTMFTVQNDYGLFKLRAIFHVIIIFSKWVEEIGCLKRSRYQC